ncbi:PadR family transcriptional regulator [Paenibacillus sp. HJGM_3]|uniref:PadR family transcriptional regulator n=1 Tax=Paenibacillus sp. HJGM_3 TaxID=3379816 RepID=UPI00385ED155
MPEWTSQVRRGILEYCILLLIDGRPSYGYELVTVLNRWEPLAITEGTLYPLLRRLVKEKVLDSFWQESESGPPRKYYSLTPHGKHMLQTMSLEWNHIAGAVNQIEAYRDEERI